MFTKNNIITLIIILSILLFSLYILTKPKENNTSEEVVKCIGQNSILYVQTGCPHCKTQENLFGENLKYIKIIDCWEQREKCIHIDATPSWEINNELYRGIQSIEKLKELTNC